MPDARCLVEHPCCALRREVQHIEGVPLLLVGVADGIANGRVTLNGAFDGEVTDALRRVALLLPDNRLTVHIRAEPHDIGADHGRRVDGRHARLEERVGHHRKRLRRRAGVIPDLASLGAEQPNLAMRDNHRLPWVSGRAALHEVASRPR